MALPWDMPPLAHSRIEILDAAGYPAVIIVDPEGKEFEWWSWYRDSYGLGIGSQRSYARSLGLFIDFVVACGHDFMDLERRGQLFRAFADALTQGTINDGEDPSCLFWLPYSASAAKRVIREVTAFTDWLAEDAGVKGLNPTRKATWAEELIFWRAWNRATTPSLLKHIKSSTKARANAMTVHTVRGRKSVPVSTEEKKAFPEEAFIDLLSIGFQRSYHLRWTQFRDQMIALLMHGGGLRLSETLHIWIPDVFEDPGDHDRALVRVYHPSEGLARYRDPTTGQERCLTRAQYLRLVYDRVPLTDLLGRRAVGWKSPLLTDSNEKFMHVFWRQSDYGRIFMQLYRTYVQIRPRVRSHPYLFIATGGEPMTVKGYEKVHAAAVRRIGLEPAKRLGTIPHGHRHAYGLWMRRGGIDKKIGQILMHHKSEVSQEVYGQAELQEVLAVLAELECRNEHSHLDLSTISRTKGNI